MRNLNECKAEIFRRSEIKLNAKRKSRRRIIALCVPLCLFCLVFALSSLPTMFKSSGTSVKAENLMEGVIPNEVEATGELSEYNPAAFDFAVRLFKESCEDGKSTLLSPLSVFTALGMTANGADGETLRQMEDVLNIPVDELNLYLYSYKKTLLSAEKHTLKMADSVWFTDADSLKIKKDFLQTVADYYGADVFTSPSNDQQFVNDINAWINENTDGMIPKLLELNCDDSAMYLINALTFDAEWENIYYEHQIKDGKFMRENGSEDDALFMISKEMRYLEDENARGFIKYYKDERYAFVALLPNLDVSLSDYVSSLDGKALSELLSSPRFATVYAKIPKFEFDSEFELDNALKSMGMTDAFDSGKANFNNLGKSSDGELHIGRVLHKTHISVSDSGTRAGAATVVEVTDSASDIIDGDEPKYVYLTRPFVYMIVDTENNIPLFMGTLTEIN